jgi:ergothioneine biosynthesis protein EgtB
MKTSEDATDLAARFQAVRRQTETLCGPLSAEDCVAQSMPDASPAKWHLAHTSWFFETFVLASPGYEPFDAAYVHLFNSYYEALGSRHPRSARGLLVRPTLAQVNAYRNHVSERVLALLDRRPHEVVTTIELGLHHEQQHQELILTDIKHLFGTHPLLPPYQLRSSADPTRATLPLGWEPFDAGLHTIGHRGTGFAFDNEGPAHRVFLEPFALATRLVTNGEYLAFVRDDGYQRPELWLSDGFRTRMERGWVAPLYWREEENGFHHYTLGGSRPIDAEAPVCHVSFYEAEAFARWAGARLPTEFEWEVVAADAPISGNFSEDGALEPLPAVTGHERPAQVFGDTWEWTSSAYAGYPGYYPPAGAIGEYNGKFMCNQMVLRGGSCATPRSHIRATYRNFFPPDARWQFSGIRLARSAS